MNELTKRSAAARIAGRYRVEAALGRGAMGAVFLVVDESTDKRLALKRVERESGPQYLALLEREYHVLASLKHARVVQVYDYGTDDSGSYYTMELLESSDLSACAPLRWPDVCNILIDLTSALAPLHARRLLHRDISAKNVRFGADGRVKLIDFGALTGFGSAENVIGTPPFVAPEALYARPLDQRTDLYSVGALAYFLLTGLHAFPASRLTELPALFGRVPKSVGDRVRELGRVELPEPPPELDALVAALLHQDIAARPRNAAELLDRLRSLSSSTHDSQVEREEQQIGSPAFIGRDGVRAELRTRLVALHDRGGALILEGPAGIGRTRALAELAIDARVSGAIVLQVESALQTGLHGVASALALRAIEALPDEARATAAKHAPTLGHLSRAMQKQLRVADAELAPLPQAPGEMRMRLQAALRDWFVALAKKRPLVLVVDDLQLADEASTAWLTTLAHEAPPGLLLLGGLRCDDDEQLEPLLETLRGSALRLRLAPLASSETLALLRSLFGDAPHAERLAELLQRTTMGLPAHCMELLELLFRRGLVRCADGSWVLPQALDETDLPATRVELLLSRLRRLTPEARLLAAKLSIRERLLSLDLCAALAELPAAELFATLEMLTRENVLVGAQGGYRFSSEVVRRALLAELAQEQASRAHRILGARMLAAPELSTPDRLQAGVHFLRGGDESGRAIIAEAGIALGLRDLIELGAAASPLEQALELARARKLADAELVALLAPLALGGYYVDRKLADRYGEEALERLQRVVGLTVTRRLRPLLGRRLSLFAGLAWGALRLKWQRQTASVPSFGEAIMLLFNCVAALTGVYTICIDPKRAHRCAEVIEPLTALGKNHVAALMYSFCKNLAATVQDRIGLAYERWTSLIERLESKEPIAGLAEHIRTFYVAGALYARGVMECWRDDGSALVFADRLDGLKLKLYEMSADQVRMMYYANQGRHELFERYRERVEMHAIQRGTAWQAETWSAGALTTVFLRTHDALQMKHSAEQLKELAKHVASLEPYAARAKGAYLLLRGRTEEALDALTAVLREEPLEVVGWGRSMGALARAYNTLGAHARAREVCLQALHYLAPEDLAFPAMNLAISVELALAEAGLGEIAAGAARLDVLLAEHALHEGPLTLGALHEARARVAELAGDKDRQLEHTLEMGRWYRETGLPTLLERSERWERQHPTQESAVDDGGASSDSLQTMLHRIEFGGGEALDASARWALDVIANHARLAHAYVFVRDDEGTRCIAQLGAAPCEEMRLWIDERTASYGQIDSMTEHVDSLIDAQDPNVHVFGDERFRVLYLCPPASMQAVGALVVEAQRAAEVPELALSSLARRLTDPRTTSAQLPREKLG